MADDGLYGSMAASVGPDHVLRADGAAFVVDGMMPRFVVSPGTVAEVQSVMRAAAVRGACVAPRGGGSKLGLGNPPAKVDVLLSLTRLDAVLEYDVANLTLVCQAGASIESLQTAARANRQFLPLDPPFVYQTTVGGVLACNSTGPRRLAYGSARDLVLGMKVVSAAGELLSAGGKTVKNVAGYDMDKLFIGSLGTLGVIVEAAFRLLPMPEERATLLAAFPSLAQALQMAGRLRGTQYLPSALEVLSPRALELCDLGQGAHALLIALEGVSEAVTRQKSEVAALCREQGSPVVEALEGDREEAAWEAVRDLGLRVTAKSPGAVATKSSVPLTGTTGICDLAVRTAQRLGLLLSMDVRAGNGILYAWLEGQSGDEPRQAAAVSEMRAAAVAAGGTLVIESAPPGVKSAVSVWGEPGSDFAAMRAIKAKLDPQGLLNTGRFVGGI